MRRLNVVMICHKRAPESEAINNFRKEIGAKAPVHENRIKPEYFEFPAAFESCLLHYFALQNYLRVASGGHLVMTLESQYLITGATRRAVGWFYEATMTTVS